MNALIMATLVAGLAAPFSFETIDVNPRAGTCPAVALADLDADNDLDLVVMSNDDIAWHENPGWARHVISPTLKSLNVCMAVADLDGDRIPEIAAGADWQFDNTQGGGSLHILRHGDDVRAPWQSAEILAEPSLHRIRWADTDGDGKAELFVAPLKGRGTTAPDFREAGVRLLQLRPPADLLREPWAVSVATQQYHVMHNLIPFRTAAGRDALLTVSFEGLTLLSNVADKWEARALNPGNPQPWPRSGSSEVKVGQLGKDLPAIACIEPWHGNLVVVYTPDAPGPLETVKTWTRHVLDDTFNQGHAVGWADFDGDGRDELVAGYREASPASQRVGLFLYAFGPWKVGQELDFSRHAVDDGGLATEDLAIGDVNGDARPDIFASARSTGNLRLYLAR